MNRGSPALALLMAMLVLVAVVLITSRARPDTSGTPLGESTGATADSTQRQPAPPTELWPTAYPTEVDLRSEARATAESIAVDRPEEGDVGILSTITDMLRDEDPYVRLMGASALGRIAMAEAAHDSGLRAAAIADGELNAALHEAVGYYPITNVHSDDNETREAAVHALYFMYADAPNPTVEAVLTDQYAIENDPLVRSAIVNTLGEHRYTTMRTEEVFLDAKDDYDPELAAIAQEYLDQLYVLRGH